MSSGLTTVVAAGCGGAAIAGLLLVVVGIRGTPPRPARPPTRRTRLVALLRRRYWWLLAGPGAAVAVAVVTRWPVAGIAAGVLTVAAPSLFGTARAGQARTARIEALATWTESLADTLAGAHALEQVIRSTTPTAPAVLTAPLDRLVGRIRAQEPLSQALITFADDLDDPVGDRIVAILVEASQVRGPDLAAQLTLLARHAREKVDARRRADAQQRSLIRNMKIIVAVSVGLIVAMALFSREFLGFYNTVLGQVVLAGVCGSFGVGFTWMYRLSQLPTEPRLPLRRETS